MRRLEPTICTLCMYHSLNVCLCDTWTEDMARSRSMTLRDTNIPRISLCFCPKVFWPMYLHISIIRGCFLWMSQSYLEIFEMIFVCLSFPIVSLTWLGLIGQDIYNNSWKSGRIMWGCCLKLSESSFKVLTQQTFLFSATCLQTFALLLLVELQTSQ